MPRLLSALLLAAALCTGPVPPTLAAVPPEQQLTQDLQAQGFRVIWRGRTWLGRVRLLAVRGDLLREVVLGPGTGEVLRDLTVRVPGLEQALATSAAGTNIGGVELPALTREKEGGAAPPSPAVGSPPPSVGSGADPAE